MDSSYPHQYLLEDNSLIINEKKSTWVLIITAVTMITEITAGSLDHSMALLADGWHMASHTAAMVISLIAYRLSRSSKFNLNLSFGTGKLIPLGGYTSALVLTMISFLMAVDSIDRFFHPEQIQFNEAIAIAALGFCVNLLSAWILRDHHDHSAHHHAHKHEHEHEHETHDYNLHSAYVHVLADALTSVLAIIALTLGKYFGWTWMDPLMGIVGSLVILKWAYGLCRDTGFELLDVHSKKIPPHRVRSEIESTGARVLDVHTWRVAPNAVACEVVVTASKLMGTDFYRKRLTNRFDLKHLVIEERQQV